jgi:hypothetical protein
LEFRRQLSSTAAFNNSRNSILGQAEERNPKEVESEARFSRRGNNQRNAVDGLTASVEGADAKGNWKLHRRLGWSEGTRWKSGTLVAV